MVTQSARDSAQMVTVSHVEEVDDKVGDTGGRDRFGFLYLRRRIVCSCGRSAVSDGTIRPSEIVSRRRHGCTRLLAVDSS